MKSRKLTIGLFVPYLVVLIWIILFKFSFSPQDLPHFRGLNLIPFAGSIIVNDHLGLSEICNNILVFMPFGIFIAMLKPRYKMWQMLIPIAGTSLALEVLQYIFSLGAADITDLLNNSLGGLIGLAIYYLLLRLSKNQAKLNQILNILILIIALALTAFLAILIIANL